MVLSLVDLSLLSIAKGIKNGTIQHPHLLPPKLRQKVLDKVLKRGLINDPKYMALLSSVEFLTGMESFGTEADDYKLEFLNRLENSMAAVLPNGETVGASIRKLNLSVFGCKVVLGDGSGDVYASSFPLVSQLINQCPNTTSLALLGIWTKKALEDRHRNGGCYSCWFPGVLNENDVCTGVMENLVELSVRNMKKVLIADRPIINFKRLTTLKLDNCLVEFDIWADFLRNVPTLENLQMIGVTGLKKSINKDLEIAQPCANGLDWILPLSMPQLKSLEIVTIEYEHPIFECNKAFVDNLMECPEIRRVQLSLDQNSTDEESMERLASMNIDLTVKARFFVHGNEDIRVAFDTSSNFKVIRIFHERMDSFELSAPFKWSPKLSTALENVTDSCSKLTTFILHIPHNSYPSVPTETELVEMNRINAALVHLFGNQERGMQLKNLRLRGNFDEAVILAIIEYCLKLDQLEIWGGPVVRDQHLIDWVSNGGGRLAYLGLQCPNVTSEGIIPILAKSAEGLLRISIHLYQAGGEGRDLETVMKNLCPYAKRW